MADGYEIDSSDLSKLSADLRFAGATAKPFLTKAMEVTGRNIRDTARKNATGMAHAPAFPYSISYDFVGSAGGLLGALRGGASHEIELEVGPDKDRAQGALGNLIEFGSIRNPPQGIMHGALQANEADFEKGIDRAIDDALKSAGL